MISSLGSALSRRTLAGSLALGAALTACAAQAAGLTMYRDANCGCCLAWAGHVERGGAHDVEAVSHPDMAAVKAAHGVPGNLLSCHTAVIDGYVIEGVAGLAVAGMPVGSPGMENGDHRQAYQVIAFGPDGRKVWSSYPGGAS
jgi:hypothetical protein